MLELLYTSFIALLDRIILILDFNNSIHKLFLSPGIGNFREGLGKMRAVRLYRRAVNRVPAYGDYIKKHPAKGPITNLGGISLGDIPEMDKASYIKKYSLLDKIWDGELPKTGVMFDESSGSSGLPTSWVRGRRERRYTKRIMQVGYRKYIGNRAPIVINTFSMGAWATGLNTTIGLLEVGRIKSTGPDILKVINTLKELGSGFDYVITGYPPFLKQVADSKEIDWKKYKIVAIYGGEGISEPMRDSLLKCYQDVAGSYGASDLEINIAHESAFTIALRRALFKDESLRKALLVQNRGIIPSIFQYNPYHYVIETNTHGELVVTIARLENLSPRIRYNIHDLGHAERFYSLRKKLKALGRMDLVKLAELDFAVLFYYGRSDLSVDYNGAVVGPEEIKQIINSHSTFAGKIRNFRLISYEDHDSHKHLLFAIEREAGHSFGKSEEAELLATIISELQVMNLDFKSALSTAPLKPEMKIYPSEDGIFDQSHQKLKNDYVWNIDYARAKQEGLAE